MKMQLKYFLFLFVLSTSLVGCSFMPDELKTVEKIIETEPDSALQILRNIPPDKYKSGESRALYGLLMIRALDKKMLPLKPDSLLDYSIVWYEKNPKSDRLATCYLYKGRTYKYANQYEMAMNYYLKALDETKDLKDFALLGRINFDMGDIYNIQGDYNAARQKYKMSYQLFSNAKYQLLAFYSLFNIGRTYYTAKNYKKAEQYYKKILLQAKDSIQSGDLYQEIGLTYYATKSYDSALYYFRRAIKSPCVGYNQSIRYCSLANLFFDVKQFDSAFYYASNAFKTDIDFRTQRECYRIMTNCEFIKGNTENVTRYMNKYVALGDSLRKVESQLKGSYMETMHDTKNEAAKSKNLIWYLVSLVFLVLAGAYWLTRFIVRRTKKEKEQIQETHSVEKAIIHKDVVEKYSKVLQQKVEKQKNELIIERKKADYAHKVILDRKIYDDLLHLSNTEIFFREMDSVLNNMVTKLKTRYPSVTVKEIYWCCLTLLEIPATDIYILLDYTVDGLKSMRKRLAQKTGLSGVAELKVFLQKIIEE